MKTGDRVICINASNMTDRVALNPILIKGREYIIYAVNKCSCGVTSFDVGLDGFNRDQICDCGKTTHTKAHWCNSTRFAKVKEQYKIIHMDIAIEKPILN